MQMTKSKVENSAQVSSCKLKFVREVPNAESGGGTKVNFRLKRQF